MQTGIAQLKKLRGKSLREIRVRGRQEIVKFRERLFSSAEMSDEAFAREITPFSPSASVEDSSALIVERIRSSFARGNQTPATFFPALARRDEVVSEMERRFPAARLTLIDRADRAMAGRFDLLGFRDLSFGSPIDWHLEPLSGKRTTLDHWSRIDYLNPAVAGDKKITWELNRHAHFVTFGQAYWLTGDEAYAEAFAAQASSWMDANPPGCGINWASSLELAFRMVAWLWALHLLAESRHLESRFVKRLLKYMLAHGRHIESYLSYYFSPNTHLTGEALGLFYLGTALPELNRASLWRKKGLGILIEQLPIHIRPDGVYFEQTTYYHRYTADFYLHLVGLARAGSVKLPRVIEDRLARSLDYLMWATRPDGTSPLIGDDDGGQLIKLGGRGADDFRDTIATGAALVGRGDWKFIAGEDAAETLWLLGPEGLERYTEIEARPPANTACAFAGGGYFVMRDGWSKRSSFALADCGPHGVSSCGHSHADALSFEFAAGGTTWLVDPGTFTYTGDARLRDRFRSTQSHNTVTIDDEPQSIPAEAFSWKRIAKAAAREFIAGSGFDYFEGSHDGYERLSDPVTHTRSLTFVKASGESLPSYLIVRDQFKARGPHHYAARYHFATGCRAEANDNRAGAINDRGDRLNLFAFGNAAPQARVEEGWVSRAYGKREQAPVAVIEARGEGPQELITFILPGDAGVSPAKGGFTIKAGEFLDTVVASDGASDVECEGFSAQARMAVGRFARGELVGACMVQGKKLEARNQFALRSPTSIRYGEAGFNDGQIEITIHGASRFELSFYEPPTRIIVNKTSFTISRNCESAVFVLQGSGWKLVSKG
ncbi:MAG TPA: alginate lyase family protein [Blastocatellia bacterium]|nr:alginate lyase family protein [Blastocatellia bacterium]